MTAFELRNADDSLDAVLYLLGMLRERTEGDDRALAAAAHQAAFRAQTELRKVLVPTEQAS